MGMKKWSFMVAMAAWLAALPLSTTRAQVPGPAPVEARVIVKFRAGSALLKDAATTPAEQRGKQAEALGKRIGVALSAGRSVSERSHVVVASGIGADQLAARLAAEGDVEYAVVDGRKRIAAAPNDPLYVSSPQAASSGGPVAGQWYLRPPGPALAAPLPGAAAPASINAEQAWDTTTGSAGIVVAVLDTGLRFDHADLQGGNVVAGHDMVGSSAIAGDGDGRDTDASDPGDSVSAAEAAAIGGDCMAQASPRSSWHGTKTLGLIGATTNNGAGIASVGRNVRVMPVRVLGKCGGSDSDVLAGMRWAAGLGVPGAPANPNKARVINLSLGGVGSCNAAYRDAMREITAAGVVVVASAGNTAGRAVGEPANCPGVIAVAGLRHVGDKVGFSDLGPEIAISAPGGNCVTVTAGSPCQYPILTTTNAGTTTPVAGAGGSTYSDSFDATVGTSFAAPLVAGAAALMLSTQPALSPAEVQAALQATARPFPQSGGTPGTPVCVAPGLTDQLECYCPVPSAGTPSVCGAGMLDVRAAVLAVAAVQARIAVDTAAPVEGQPVSFSSASLLSAGRAVASYEWKVVNGGGIVAAFASATNAATATIVPAAAGAFSVSLTVVDDLGVVSTATSTVTVAPAAPPTPTGPAASSNDDGGGGGALGVEWLGLLLSAVIALARCRERRNDLPGRAAGRRGARPAPGRPGRRGTCGRP